VSISLSPELTLLSGNWEVLSCGALSGEVNVEDIISACKSLKFFSGLALDGDLSLFAVLVVFSGLRRSVADDFLVFSGLAISGE
jgi:hypothetical protein